MPCSQQSRVVCSKLCTGQVLILCVCVNTAQMGVYAHLPRHIDDSASCNVLIKNEEMFITTILYIYYILLL